MSRELFERDFKPYFENKKEVAKINRSYPPEIIVVLSCGYTQRFAHQMDDENAVARCRMMKRKGIETKTLENL
ncbi:hypothetical protein GCM10011344_32640 [Dokdonia pacifica]|uniref:Uncharacterized protein n=1 Tax=Dokdonia pacifica TaxID=1627892 RepID=A0A239BHL2_9FLAO|nr:hypothetical protein [Dokdonia pacifica]GGG29263.1 hypothetical protein GCM10011344_32640 [Dokdonia pacifica]SNS07657.1 hypothetical protein SAMN06265376_106199 [Dokdonia pacifica]